MAAPATIAGAQLRCPNCGAPMRWKGTAEVVECRYCRAHVVPATGAQTQAPATARTQVPARTVLIVWGAVFGVAVLLSVIGAVVAGRGPGGLGARSADDIRRLSLASTPAAIAAKLGAKSNRDNAVFTNFRGTDFASIDLVWEDKSSDHVKGFTFIGNGPSPKRKAIGERLRRYLRGRLVESKDGLAFNWNEVHVSSDEPMTYLSFQVNRTRTDWKATVAELWKVAWAVVLDEPLQVSDEVGRAHLGWGHPLDTLAKIDLGMTVDQAKVELPKRFAGTKIDKSSDLYGSITVEHPWIDSASLHWENAQNGPFVRAYLNAPMNSGGFRDQKAVEQCVAKSFGSSTVQETDHLAGTWSADWSAPAGVRLSLHKDFVIFFANSPKEVAAVKREWQKLIEQLGKCGR